MNKKIIWLVLGVISIYGFLRGFGMMRTQPPESFAFIFFTAESMGLLHIVSQIFFVLLFIFSLYLLLRKKN